MIASSRSPLTIVVHISVLLLVALWTVNFIFLDLKAGGWNSAAFAQQMRRRGILIRDCANYSGLGDTFIRVAVKSHNENQQLLDAFRDILAGGAQ